MSTTLTNQERSQQRRGGLWAYVSPSRLNLWLRCPLAFRLKYVDGIRSPTSPAMFLGKMCHAALEAFYRRRQQGTTPKFGEVIGHLGEVWAAAATDESMEFESSAKERALRGQAAELIAAYLAQIPADEPQPLAIEQSLEVPLVDPTGGEDLGIPLFGIIDLVVGDHDGPTIVDFKTAARSTAPLEVSHEIQLTAYAWLFRHVSGRPESGLEIRSLIKTKVPQIKVHRYGVRTEFHLCRWFAVVREYLDALDAGRFNFRPGLACSMCDYRQTHCRNWCG